MSRSTKGQWGRRLRNQAGLKSKASRGTRTRKKRFSFETLEDRNLLAVQPFPVPLESVEPLSSLIYQGSTASVIDFAGDSEQFTINLDAHQRITLLAEPSASLTPALSIRDPSANLLADTVASAAGENAWLQTVEVATAGTYTISLFGAAGSTGGFSLKAYLNSALEADRIGGSANDSPASAQSLDASFISLGPGTAQRGAVVGLGSANATEFSGSLTQNNNVFTGNVLPFNFGSALPPSGDATLTVSAFADLDSPSEFLTLNAEGLFTQDLFVVGGLQQQLVTTDVVIPQATLQLLAADGTVSFTVTPSGSVGNLGTNFLTLDLVYPISSGSGDLGGWYSFTLADNQSASIIASSAGGVASLLELYGPDGTTLLAQGLPVAGGQLAIDDFVDTTSDLAPGTYFVRVGSAQEYNLVITRDATIDREPNNEVGSSAQDITQSGTVLGSVANGVSLPTGSGPLVFGPFDVTGSPLSLGFASDGSFVGVSVGALHNGVEYLRQGTFLASNTVSFNGSNYTNAAASYGTAFPVLMDNLSSGSQHVIRARGDIAGTLSYERIVSWKDGDNHAFIFTTITNFSAAPINNVAILENHDPDPAGSVTTSNDVTAGGQLAVGSNFNGAMALGSPDPRAVVSAEGFFVSNPFDVINSPEDPNLGSGDIALNVAFNLGTLAPGASETTALVAVFGANQAAIEATYAAVADQLQVGDVDAYTVQANAGDVLNITTTVPAAGPGEFINNLDPAIELYDPLGVLVASSATGALSHVAGSSGTYSVRMLAENNSEGEYVLRVTGHTGGLPAFEVTTSDPADGAALQTAPSQIVIDFSDTILLSSVDAGDLLIDGSPATNVIVADHNLLVFDLPALADGPHTLSIAAGAISDLQGQALEPFTMQMFIDATGPTVISSSVLEGDIVEAGPLTYTATFDEALFAAVLDANDVQLVGVVSGAHVPSLFNYDAGTSTLTLQFADLPEDDYTLRLVSGVNGFRDAAGNLLDGEADPTTTVPSGNGVVGGSFVVNFIVDTMDGVFPTPFVPAGPLGSLMYSSEVTGRIAPAADSDEYSMNLDHGQQLTIVVAAEFRAVVTVLGPDSTPVATVAAAAPGDGVVVQGIPINVAGEYTVRVESLGGIGNYSIEALLNAVAESEEHGGPANDSAVGAEDLNAAFIDLPDGASQYAAVAGRVTGGLAGVVFEDTFPTNVFNPTKWQTVSNAQIDTSGIGEPSEIFSARLNGDPSGGDAMESVVIDLSGQTGAAIRYWFEQTGGGETVDPGEDLILWYQNSSGTWVELERQFGSGPSMTSYEFREVVLPAEALHANFRFRFTNIATAGLFDDWFIDDISVVGNSVAPTGGDWYSFSLNDGESATIAIDAAGPVVLDLYDSTGTVKLASGVDSANWAKVIENFVDATVDGSPNTYLVQVLGSNLDYQLSVARDADLDLGENNNSGQAQDITGINHVVGHVSGGGEDWYQIAVNGGDQLMIDTFAPANGPFEFFSPLAEGRVGGLIISEVVDGTLVDGNPKFVEITNTGDTAYTFTAGGLIVQSNNSVDRTVDVDLDGVTILAGQSFVIATTANDGQAVFESTYGFAADLYVDALLGDGNDRLILTDTDDGSHLLDIYGVLDTNGTGQSWEFTDSYAHRTAFAINPNGAAFNSSGWIIAGINSLETGNDVTETQLLQTLTTPGMHSFIPGGKPLVQVELYDPLGAQVESDIAGISHLATQSGVYRARIVSLGLSGEYVMAVMGATGMNNAPTVALTDPIDGALLNQFPTTLTLTFSEPLLAGAVTASDLLVNGVQAATAVTQIDAYSFTFDLNPAANIGDGQYTVELPAGAVEDLSGKLNDAFSATFTYDATGPIVTNVLFNGAALPLGGNLLAGALTVEVFFNEDLHAELTPGELGLEDVVLRNQLTNDTVTPTSVTYDSATNKVTLVFPEVEESVYRLTLISGVGAFYDSAGNPLDGEAQGPSHIGTPSGNGSPGGDYVVQFQTDAVGPRSLEPFERLRPLGSFMAVSEDNVGLIGSPGDVDNFQINVQAGQVLSAVLTPDNPNATIFLSLLGVAGPVFSVTPGQPVALPASLIPISGPLTFQVFGNTITTYSLDVYANAALELAVGDSADGHELALDNTRLNLGSGRWGAIGNTAATPSLSTIYTQDFNFNVGGFVFNNTSFGPGNGLWHRSTGRQLDGQPHHSPASSIYFGRNEGPLGGGNFDNGSATAGTATSPSIAVPNAEVVLLNFNHFLATDGVPGRDIAEIAINNGSGFVTLVSTANGTLTPSTGGQWQPITLDVSQYAGQSITLQFRFNSVTALQNQFEGWYIDDIRIQAANSYLADIDEYTLDLTSYVGQPIDFVVAAQSGNDLSDATVQLLGPDGTTVLATASTSPQGDPTSNFDQSILAYVPTLAGRYTLRVMSDDPGQYGVLVTESLPIETEPNDAVDGLIRPIGTNPGLGFLGDAGGPGGGGGGSSRLFAVVASTSEVVEYDPVTGAELNRFALPELATGQPDGLGFDGHSLFYAEGPAFAGSGILYELDPDTGAVLDADTFASLGLTSGICGLGSYAGLTFAIDTLTSQFFFIDTSADVVVGSAIAAAQTRGGAAGAGDRGTIFANSFISGLIFELNPGTGQVLNVLGAPGPQIEGLAYVDGFLYAGNNTGQIFQLDPDTGAVLNSFFASGSLSALAGDDPSGALPTFAPSSPPVAVTPTGPVDEKVSTGAIAVAAMTAVRPVEVSLAELSAQLLATNYNPTASSFNASAPGSSSPTNLIISPESEPNDSPATADFVPLGFGIGQDAAVDVTASLGAASSITEIFPVEDNGSIPVATPTGLTFGNRVMANATIGDGPFGSSSGDYDWYAIPGVLAGQSITIDIDASSIGSGLDSYVGIYNSAGTLLAANDDTSTLDSFLNFSAPSSDTYYAVVRGYGGSFQSDPFNSGSGSGPASQGFYRVFLGLGVAGGSGDIDYYRVSLSAGDIIGAGVSGSGSSLTLIDANGLILMGSTQDATFIHPASSPLPGGNAALSRVIDTAGDYFVAVSGTSSGNYTLNLRAYRPVMENELVGTHQTLFLDFNGATLDTSIFGGAGLRTLSPLTSFLGGWGLTAADESAVIDAIIAAVEENISSDVRALGNNGDFAVSGIPGEFGIEILNSRDHADPFGLPNVSRVIIGGSISELGISTIGIAETIDVGNFDTSESAVVLLDLLSAPSFDPNSLNQYPRDPSASIIDLIGIGVGNITSHEAGHFFAAWHTNQFNFPPSVMDQGGNLSNHIGLVGSIWGDGDEFDVDFGRDTFVSNEGFTGLQDSLNAIAFGLSTGRFDSAVTGPRVTAVSPLPGVTHDVNITTISLTFSETLEAVSANSAANYQLLDAGPNGIFDGGAGDDAVILVTPLFNGDRGVELTIRDGNTPLGFGKYRLTVDGDNSIVDLDGNPLNSISGPGGGSDFVHNFDIVFQVPEGGDFYRLDLLAGQQATVSTQTPWSDPLGSFSNDLDTRILVYNNVGTLIATDSDSGEGVNALATIVALVDGPYFVQVVADAGAGEYLLDAQIDEVVLLGDYNRDWRVDAADYTVWRNMLGQGTAAYALADGNGDSSITPADDLIWRQNYGTTLATATPEQLVVPSQIGGSGGLAADETFVAADTPAAEAVEIQLASAALEAPTSESAIDNKAAAAAIGTQAREFVFLDDQDTSRKLAKRSDPRALPPVLVSADDQHDLLDILGAGSVDPLDADGVWSPLEAKDTDFGDDWDASVEASDSFFAELGGKNDGNVALRRRIFI